jgi:hypothetical protein
MISVEEIEKGVLTDHKKGDRNQAKIKAYQEKWGSKNRKVVEELGFTDEDARNYIGLHCKQKDCPNHGTFHEYILSSRPALIWTCKHGNIGFWLALKDLGCDCRV